MSWLDRKTILVAGGTGFIGSHVVEQLLKRAPRARVTVAFRRGGPGRRNLAAVAKDVRWVAADLFSPRDCRRACRGQEVVLNVAGRVAAVAYNAAHPAAMYRDNAAIAGNLLEAARLEGARRFLLVSSASVYALDAPVPTPESAGLAGRPDASSEGYAWAKRAAELLAGFYAREYGLEVAIARPNNVYGPRDRFGQEHSHVIAALIHRAVSGEDPIVVRGDGKARRSFLYVEDAARGLLDVVERHAKADPVNLDSGEEVSIADLARRIAALSGSGARLSFDRSKPSGQRRRVCDARKAARLIGFRPRVSLEEGLRRTIEWYRAS